MDRGSVAMGDDSRPHDETLDLPPETPLADVVGHILGRPFLATIASGKATWILVTGRRPLAVVAQQWDHPRFLVDPSLPIRTWDDEGRGVALMFRYWKQHDPDHVFDELAAGREPPR
ncbi:hypothetical protein ABGB06_26430 [Streptomyces sp. B6B3]